ncbi:hypothetical protein UFOVP118_32 [uncultured Caudovirales phage]|uniref:Uncharacterized protein n=1 Tax=uncultured Caudovirales phage TaxID=2100421 RepID=A0A6J5L7A6_9CAUD|nr:hypothetical protein UFOVP118_32 [uncultured Caudovirales phage]
MWNHRVVNLDDDDEVSLEIREVYYDQEGNPYGHCGAEVFGTDLQELDRVMTRMRQAFDQPILTKEDFVGDPKI